MALGPLGEHKLLGGPGWSYFSLEPGAQHSSRTVHGRGSAGSQTDSEQHIAELQEVMEVTGFTAGSSFYRCGNGSLEVTQLAQSHTAAQ